MKAELITIGQEFMLGQVLDLISPFLAQRLSDIGLELSFKVAVGDDRDNLREALFVALSRSEVIITAGGIGSSEHDVTREVIAELTGNPLVFHDELMTQITEFFHRIRKTPSPEHLRQAYLPEGALPIHNPVGSAPGFILKHEGRAVIALPGTSAELQHMTRYALIPFLMERGGLHSKVYSRIMKVVGLSEPLIEREMSELVSTSMNPVIGFVTYPGETHIRLTARAENRTEAESLLVGVENRIRQMFGEFIYGSESDTLESVVAQMMMARGMDIAVVETYTAGLVSERLYGTVNPVLKQGRLIGRKEIENPGHGCEKLAGQLAAMVREETGASLGLAAISENVAGVESTNLWVAITSETRSQIATSLMARKLEVNRPRAVSFCLDQIRRFLLAEPLLASARTLTSTGFSPEP